MLNKELVLQSNAKSSIVYGHVVTFGHGDSVWNPDGDPYWFQLHGKVQSIGQLRSTELRIYVLAPQEALYA